MATTNYENATAEAYLKQARDSGQRLEYYYSRIYESQLAALNHFIVLERVRQDLNAQLPSSPIGRVLSNPRVYTGISDAYLFPQYAICKDMPQWESAHHDILLNPNAIIEIYPGRTGDQSWDHDWTRFRFYQTIPSLCDYVHFHWYSKELDHFIRKPGNRWLRVERDAEDSPYQIESIGYAIDIRRLYADLPDKRI